MPCTGVVSLCVKGLSGCLRRCEPSTVWPVAEVWGNEMNCYWYQGRLSSWCPLVLTCKTRRNLRTLTIGRVFLRIAKVPYLKFQRVIPLNVLKEHSLCFRSSIKSQSHRTCEKFHFSETSLFTLFAALCSSHAQSPNCWSTCCKTRLCTPALRDSHVPHTLSPTL